MNFLDQPTLMKLLQSGLIAAVALLLFFGLDGRMLGLARRAKLPRLALAPVRLLLRYGILVVAALILLTRWGFRTDALIAVLGTVLGLVAIGFVAVWSVLSNFLCTFVLIIFRPFFVGDEVELPATNVKGKVIDLSLVYTTLETAPGETVLVPNNTFFQTVFKRRIGTVSVDLEHQLRTEQPHAEARQSTVAATERVPAS